jgi:hypothetical protein
MHHRGVAVLKKGGRECENEKEKTKEKEKEM